VIKAILRRSGALEFGPVGLTLVFVRNETLRQSAGVEAMTRFPRS
jgi:hypothetical protein